MSCNVRTHWNRQLVEFEDAYLASSRSPPRLITFAVGTSAERVLSRDDTIRVMSHAAICLRVDQSGPWLFAEPLISFPRPLSGMTRSQSGHGCLAGSSSSHLDQLRGRENSRKCKLLHQSAVDSRKHIQRCACCDEKQECTDTIPP